MEFITLTRDDPEFERYLLGTFARDRRALPVETYHASTVRERVTFRVVPFEKLDVPSWWRVYLRSSRPELLGLTLGPAMVAWLSHSANYAEWSRWTSWFALIGLFFLHTAAFLLNDVQDHLRGQDRANRQRGSRVIQRGWVRAADMKRWAWLNFSLAVLFGVPAFFNAPRDLAVVCGLAALSLLIVMRGWGTRWGLADLALGLLFGPLLTMGIALASFGEADLDDLLLGVSFGALTVWVFQVRQFEAAFRARPESSRSLIGHLDFDWARRLLVYEGVALLILQPAAAMALKLPLMFLGLTAIVGAPMILTLWKFVRAASPLSSNLIKSSHWALASHVVWTVWWMLALGVAWL